MHYSLHCLLLIEFLNSETNVWTLDACKALLSEVMKGGIMDISAIRTNHSLLLGGKNTKQMDKKIGQLRKQITQVQLDAAREAAFLLSETVVEPENLPREEFVNFFGIEGIPADGSTNVASGSQNALLPSDTVVGRENSMSRLYL